MKKADVLENSIFIKSTNAFVIRKYSNYNDCNKACTTKLKSMLFLQSLNTRFSGDLHPSSHRSFPDEYFTCQAKCSACESRCLKQMNHNNGHHTDSVCIYRRDVDNKQYYCLRWPQEPSLVLSWKVLQLTLSDCLEHIDHFPYLLFSSIVRKLFLR